MQRFKTRFSDGYVFSALLCILQTIGPFCLFVRIIDFHAELSNIPATIQQRRADNTRTAKRGVGGSSEDFWSTVNAFASTHLTACFSGGFQTVHNQDDPCDVWHHVKLAKGLYICHSLFVWVELDTFYTNDYWLG